VPTAFALALAAPAAARAVFPDEPGVSDDAQLVNAARGGDGEAFGELVRRHERRVFALCSRFARRRPDVEDAAQETFLRAWTKLASYRAEAPFEHWLTRLCINVCIERARRRRRPDDELPSELPARAADPTAALDAARALAQLDPADRYVLAALDVEGVSTEEIAHRLGWSRTNVKVRAFRARRRLRRWFEGGERSR
jgi:RNA polymerase sigma-70 factor (ECF subfamily)